MSIENAALICLYQFEHPVCFADRRSVCRAVALVSKGFAVTGVGWSISVPPHTLRDPPLTRPSTTQHRPLHRVIDFALLKRHFFRKMSLFFPLSSSELAPVANPPHRLWRHTGRWPFFGFHVGWMVPE